MEGKLIRQFIIPKGEGRAFELLQGQVLRIIEVEGRQVADLTALNLHDFKEVLSPEQTVWANRSFRRATRLYSKSPRQNLLLTVTDDPVGVHWVRGSGCSQFIYRALFNVEGYRGCWENLAEALAPFGIGPDDVPGTFNVFMNVELDAEQRPEIRVPVSKKGDYIDMRAEMDLLVAISACPSYLSATNEYAPKPLGIEIYAL